MGVVIAQIPPISPPAQCNLQAINRQWCEGDDKGCGDAGGNTQSGFSQEEFGEPESCTGIGKGNGEQAPATEAFPAQGHEQAHSADGDQPAEVVKDVC